MNRPAGFTLLEVLVALAVLAIAMAALLRIAGSDSTTFAALRARTIAGWVAANAVAELRLSPGWPRAGSRLRGTARMAGRDWPWTITVQNTADPDLRRLDVSVRASGSALPEPLLTAFLGRRR